MLKKIITLIILLGVGACQKSLKPSNSSSTISYLALGDSYTIGESVAETDRWPVLLVKKLQSEGLDIAPPTIIAKTGWTTDELTSAIEKQNITKQYDLVSLLIGVNNQYRGRPLDNYKIEFEGLLKKSIAFAGGMAENVFVVSIPDYGVTPFAKNRNPQKIAAELSMFNEAQKEICEEYGVSFYDITPFSKTAQNMPDLVASDGLHPSGKMYEGWVNIFFEDVQKKLQK